MPILRATELVHAPARTVTGAVISLVSRRAHLVSVSDFSVSAVLSSDVFRAARITGECAQTAAGTLLTCSFSWVGGVFDVMVTRRPVLALATSVASGAAALAESLVEAQVVVGTAIVRDGRILAQQRAFPDSVAGLWELPGGRVEPGETDHAAVRRECDEELGVAVEPGSQVGPDVILPSGRLLRIYQGAIAADAQPVAREHKEVRWLARDELFDVDWLPADRILLDCLLGLDGFALAGQPGEGEP
jgi:8-oxo-dGTP diphosphatase